ncbi:hypothetical protein UFOVP345_8 [uncultured Caudovirales phage]|uniref:Uncharacterized protein n=1 Tax=uncultured Caudovirales phage TaxID=2100421 RepID=A0A6J5LYL4_9CAUD|nr:hypothetical protein UFOVP345_8 [uncultured Caudovirales phage]
MTGDYLDKTHPADLARRVRDLESRVRKLEAERFKAIAASSAFVTVTDPRERARELLWAQAADALQRGGKGPLG